MFVYLFICKLDKVFLYLKVYLTLTSFISPTNNQPLFLTFANDIEILNQSTCVVYRIKLILQIREKQVNDMFAKMLEPNNQILLILLVHTITKLKNESSFGRV